MNTKFIKQMVAELNIGQYTYKLKGRLLTLCAYEVLRMMVGQDFNRMSWETLRVSGPADFRSPRHQSLGRLYSHLSRIIVTNLGEMTREDGDNIDILLGNLPELFSED